MVPVAARFRRAYFAGIAVCVLLASVVGGTAYLLARDRQAALEAVTTAQGNMALGLERDILRNLAIYDLSLRAAASGLQLLEGTNDPAVQNAILFDGSTNARYFRPMVIADRSGIVLRDAAAATPRLATVDDRPYFAAHRDRDNLGLLVQLLKSRIDDTMFLSLSRRVRAADGSFAGTVSGGIDIAYFQDLFSHFTLPPGGVISMIGFDGRMVAGFPIRAEKTGMDMSGSGLVEQAMAGPTSTYETTPSMIDGVIRVATVRKLGALPFFLVVAMPSTGVYADWRTRAGLGGAALLAFGASLSALLFVLCRELRRRKLAEAKARAGEVRLTAYVDHLADGILAVRLGTDRRWTYERVNAAAADILCIRAEDALGRSAREVWPGPVGEFAEGQWRECLAAGETIRYERSHDTIEGRRVLRFVMAPVRDGTDEINLLLLSLRDVTDTVDLENRLRQAQRMEAVGQLTAGVAHDFNNMLQAQLGAIELLVDEVADRPHALEMANLALNAGEHGARLTHSLLSFSRQQHLMPRAVAISPLLDGLQRMLSHTLGPQIELAVTVDDEATPPFADPAQLEAALLNLALNARDAMPDGGQLRIEARAGRAADGGGARDERAAGSVLLAVTDTGLGMEPEVASRSCEPFFTTKGVGKGSGLGLSMVQGFVQQSGGNLCISSEPGRGTRVELWLPSAAVDMQPAGATSRRQKRRNTGRVLVVDDMLDVLAITAELLEEYGFEVVQAVHGEEALAILASERPFDIIVTDYMMPGLNGGELVRRACLACPGLRALVVTGYTDLATLGDLPPHVRVVRKPLRGDALAQHVSDVLDAPGNLQHEASMSRAG